MSKKKMKQNNNDIPVGYKMSTLGVIPQEWEVQRLGEVATKIGSGVTPRGGEAVYKVKGHHFIRSQNVGWGHLIIDNVAYIDESTHKKQISTELCIDDVLLNITGASIGRCALVSPRISGGNVNQHVCIIRVDKKYILPFYLSSYLLSEKGQQVIDSYQAGGNRQGLNFEQIKSFVIPIPKLKEQEKIADVLSLWDSAIKKQGALVDTLTRRKRALMQQLLTARKRLPNFTEPWTIKTVNEICIVGRGRVISKEEINNNKGNYPVYSSQTANNGEFGRLNTYNFEGEYVTWTTDGINAGTVFYRNGKFNCTNVCGTLKVKNEIYTRFLAYKLSTIAYKYVSKTLANPKLMNEIMKEITVDLPTFTEQKAIAEVLSTADQEIELAKKRLDSFRTQKSALMQQLLTGKKRVKLQTN